MCAMDERKGSLGAARSRHLAQTAVSRSVAGRDRLCDVLRVVASAVLTLYLDLFWG